MWNCLPKDKRRLQFSWLVRLISRIGWVFYLRWVVPCYALPNVMDNLKLDALREHTWQRHQNGRGNDIEGGLDHFHLPIHLRLTHLRQASEYGRQRLQNSLQ